MSNSAAQLLPMVEAPTGARQTGRENTMDWKLEVVVVPVSDIDRAKSFYVGKLGFHLDADTRPTESLRAGPMTPPGAARSVVVGPVQIPAGPPPGPRARLQLVVPPIAPGRGELAGRRSPVPDLQAAG